MLEVDGGEGRVGRKVEAVFLGGAVALGEGERGRRGTQENRVWRGEGVHREGRKW